MKSELAAGVVELRAYINLERFTQTEALTRSLTEEAIRVLPEDHNITMTLLDETARILLGCAQLIEAVEFIEQVLRLKEQYLGLDHDSMSQSFCIMIECLVRQGRAHKAFKGGKRC